MKDHVQLGKELDLFHQAAVLGRGLPMLTPRGATVLRLLKRFVEDEELSRGYEYTATPFLASEQLYKISGHWDLYRKQMFLIEDPSGYLALRPMTCPFQFQLYLRKGHSYRDLPVRYAETSSLFRNEASGAMHGLIRTRQFTLSEGHIICRPDQVEAEFVAALNLVRHITAAIGLDGYFFRFSTRGGGEGKFIDDREAWERSEAMLRGILDGLGEDYQEAPGEAAFYGPKLDVQYRDAWGREETLFTLQLDFALAARFGMEYTDAAGQAARPMIIHRSSIGCYERTLAILLERYQGRLPFWLAPEQVRLVAVGEAGGQAATGLLDQLRAAGLRCELDRREESLGWRIRDASRALVPAVLVLGDREAGGASLNLRLGGGKESRQLDRQAVIDWLVGANRLRRLELAWPD